MKRLFTILALLLLATGCTKEVDVSQDDMSGENVKFTASVVEMVGTRGALINSWSGDEDVAVFVGEKLCQFSVAADGTMIGDAITVDKGETITYTAFYPYDKTLTTISEYQAACVEGYNDYMTATATSADREVNLQFTHSLAVLSFSILIEGEVTHPAISLAKDGNLSNMIALEFESTYDEKDTELTVNYFMENGTDISSAIIKLEQNGSTSIHSIKREDSNTLEAGKSYPYKYIIGNVSALLGSGTQSDPYLIYTADAMRKVSTVADGLSAHYKLMNDIDLGGVNAAGYGVADNVFTPIGSKNNEFTGSFDGNGHVISGIYINQPSSDYQGLFGYVGEDATIKTLGVGGIVIGASYVGGIAGMNKGIINNCYNTVDVYGKGDSYFGGIAGYSYGSVIDCYNTAKIDGTSKRYVGGIIGYNEGIVECCYSNAKVIGFYIVGGTIGYNDSDGHVVCSFCEEGVTGSNKSIGGGSGYKSSAEELDTEEMKSPDDSETSRSPLSFFKNYGESTAWVADDAENPINNGYPILKWQISNK